MSKFNVGDLVRRKPGALQNGMIRPGEQFYVRRLCHIRSGVYDHNDDYHSVSNIGLVRRASWVPAVPSINIQPKKGHHPVHTGLQQHSVGSIYPYILVGYGNDTWGINDSQGRELRSKLGGARFHTARRAVDVLKWMLAGHSTHAGYTFDPPAPPPTPVDDSVTLKLTRAQAETLLEVCARIGGQPELSPRGDMDAISAALNRQSVRRPYHKVDTITAGTVYFADRE